tara:strand:- start:1844 stop:2050 length:207 start_codon:yes stop_codon:yes gene_type:complete
MNITKQQWEAFNLTMKLANKQAYGHHHMFAEQAIKDSGLDKDTYMYIINHMKELHQQFDKGDDNGKHD